MSTITDTGGLTGLVNPTNAVPRTIQRRDCAIYQTRAIVVAVLITFGAIGACLPCITGDTRIALRTGKPRRTDFTGVSPPARLTKTKAVAIYAITARPVVSTIRTCGAV